MATHTKPTHFLSGKSISVIGAGISGSAFVASLLSTWNHDLPPPNITVFDRDPTGTFERRGGYSLSLLANDASGGLLALKKIGILDNVLRSSISGAAGDGMFKLWTANWKELVGRPHAPMDGLPTASVRIFRAEIRRLLLEAAQLDRDGAVQWNTQCLSVTKLPSGCLAVQTRREDESEVRISECDLVIVADGANSKIRAHLRPNDTLEYAGAVMRMGVSRFSEAIPRQIGRDWGFVLSGTGVSCFVSPVGEKSLQWSVGHFEGQASTEIRDSHDEKLVIQRACELASHISDPFPEIISRTDPNSVMCINAQDKLPFQHSSIEEMPVVFIGDSNHALSPFAGAGANLGLCDAWDLAEQFVKGSSLKCAVEAYDEISFPRATKVVTGARKMLRAGHSTGLRYLIFVFLLAISRLFRWILRR